MATPRIIVRVRPNKTNYGAYTYYDSTATSCTFLLRITHMFVTEVCRLYSLKR